MGSGESTCIYFSPTPFQTVSRRLTKHTQFIRIGYTQDFSETFVQETHTAISCSPIEVGRTTGFRPNKEEDRTPLENDAAAS